MQLRMNCFKVEWCVALLIFMSPLAKVETFLFLVDTTTITHS